MAKKIEKPLMITMNYRDLVDALRKQAEQLQNIWIELDNASSDIARQVDKQRP
jgi:hypothetical protein